MTEQNTSDRRNKVIELAQLRIPPVHAPRKETSHPGAGCLGKSPTYRGIKGSPHSPGIGIALLQDIRCDLTAVQVRQMKFMARIAGLESTISRLERTLKETECRFDGIQTRAHCTRIVVEAEIGND